MHKWTDKIDPSTIPDAVLASERARRNQAKRQTFGAGTGRPKTLVSCPRGCGYRDGVVAMRRHKCAPQKPLNPE